MSVTRRQFLKGAAAAALVLPIPAWVGPHPVTERAFVWHNVTVSDVDHITAHLDSGRMDWPAEQWGGRPVSTAMGDFTAILPIPDRSTVTRVEVLSNGVVVLEKSP